MRARLSSAKPLTALQSRTVRNAPVGISIPSRWTVAPKLNFPRRNLSLITPTSKSSLLPSTKSNGQLQRYTAEEIGRLEFPTSRFQAKVRSNSTSSRSSISDPESCSSSTSKSNPKPYYITTPIFYVNAIPHVGHLHSMVLADVLARWNQWRFNGISQPNNPTSDKEKTVLKSILSTGTDEHGLKIQTQAQILANQEKQLIQNEASLSEEEKRIRIDKIEADPKSLCDRISQRFKALAEAADIKYTRFIRTTEAEHEEAVKTLWKRLVERGHIYKGSHEGWYAISDEAFYTSLQVQEIYDEKTGETYMASIETGTRVEWTKEENYKFRMSAFKDDLIDWLENNPKAICPPMFHSEVLAELKSTSGLSDLSISRPRSRLTWGIQVPDDPEHTIYVWVDALTNYLTVSGYPWKETESRNDWEGSCWPADVHVVGKDIIRFHAIYFPALLLALDLPLPKTILTHSHWTMNKQKMSKSRGNVADPFAAMDLYGTDAIRWYLMRVGGTLDADSDYSPFTLQQHYKKNLAGQLGNLLSRVSSPSILSKLIDSLETLPSPQGALCASVSAPVPELTESDLAFVDELDSLADRFTNHLDNFALSKANEEISTILMKINTIVQDLSPWLYQGRKIETDLESIQSKSDCSETSKVTTTTLSEAHRAVYLSIEVLRIVSSLYAPIMPSKMKKLRETLGFSEEECQFDRMKVGGARGDGKMNLRIGAEKIEPLFPRVNEDVSSKNQR